MNNSSLNNTTETDDVFSSSPRGPLLFGGICFIAYAVIGVIGNFISILALTRCSRLRNATTAFVVNLCVADLLFCGITMPLSAVLFLEAKKHVGVALCKVFPLMQYSNAFVSVLSVSTITVNRYILVVHPRFYPSVYSKRNIGIMIAFIWFISFLFLIFPLLEIWGRFGYERNLLICTILEHNGKSPRMFIHVIGIGLPFIIFIACYTRIFFVVRKASKRAIRYAEDISKYTPPRDRKELRVLRVMLVIFILFCVCYFPAILIDTFSREGVKYLNVFGILGIYFSNIINPVIYIVMNKGYRKAYKELFRC